MPPMLRLSSTALLLVTAACTGRAPGALHAGVPHPATTPQVKHHDTCEVARLLRQQAQTFHAAGKLERTIRTVARANRLCMQEAPSSQDLLRQAEIELGQGDSSRAGAAATITEGEALLRLGLAKKARGDVVSAQELFDRARIALERATAEKTALLPNTGIWEVSAIAWSGNGARLAIAAGQDVRILNGEGFSEVLRLRSDARPVTAIAISPDARTLVSAGGDHDLELWTLIRGHAHARLR